MTRASCNCAERTGELVAFTCSVCCSKALVAMKALIPYGLLVRLDEEGSVSGMEVEVGEPHGQK